MYAGFLLVITGTLKNKNKSNPFSPLGILFLMTRLIERPARIFSVVRIFCYLALNLRKISNGRFLYLS